MISFLCPLLRVLQWTNFRLRVLFTLAVMQISSWVFVPFALLTPWRHDLNLINYGWLTSKLNPLMGLKWMIEVRDPEACRRPHLVMLNHQENTDAIGLTQAASHIGPFHALAKRELMYFGLYGVGMWLCGTVFIDRSDPVQARKTLKALGVKCKEKGGCHIVCFPEGTRNLDRNSTLLPFKKGCFHLALESGLDILPAVISTHDFIDRKSNSFNNGTAVMRFLEPIKVSNFDKANVEKLVEHTKSIMSNEIEKLNRELAKKE